MSDAQEYKSVDISDVWEYANRVWDFRDSFNAATNYLQRLKVIANYWKSYELEIISKAQRNLRLWHSSYPIDWNLIFSPIESEAWMSIRCKGGVVLYPQWPVLNYHVDFGNPLLKIALELDGKEYHDRDKDYDRDMRLKEIGWKVYRIPGHEMVRRNYKDFSDFFESEAGWEFDGYEDIRDWILNTGDGVIEAIKAIHFSQLEVTSENSSFLGMCELTLQKHCLVDHE